MDKSLRLTFARGDLLAVALVVLLALMTLIAYLPSGDAAPNAKVQVYRDSVLVDEMPLDTDRTFYVDGDYQNEVAIQNGKVSITHSTCPGGDCLRMNAISAPGRTIVCLPNRVELRVVAGDGTTDSDVDFVVR